MSRKAFVAFLDAADFQKLFAGFRSFLPPVCRLLYLSHPTAVNPKVRSIMASDQVQLFQCLHRISSSVNFPLTFDRGNVDFSSLQVPDEA
jgi:hypothetical protein